MLKHVEASVAEYALRWFQKNELGLAAMYAPHAQLDAQFRGRLENLRASAHRYESLVGSLDPDEWPADVVLGAFQACLMLKDALDAAGPILLRRTHEVIGRAAVAAGVPVLDPRAVAGGPRGRRLVAPRPKKTTKKAKRRHR